MTVQATDTDDDTEYREDVFKVSGMRFLDANGNEATEYVEGDTARLEVTLTNNSDSDLELIENGMWLKLYSEDIYDYDGGEIRSGQGETKKVIVTKKITKAEAEEFRTIGIYSADIISGEHYCLRFNQIVVKRAAREPDNALSARICQGIFFFF